MSYAIRKDGYGWRCVDGPDDIGADEVFSDTQPLPPKVDMADANGLELRRRKFRELAKTDPGAALLLLEELIK